PPLLRRRRAQRIDRLDQSGLMLGVRTNETYQESVFRFEQGDRLLLYSDGLTDAENPSGDSFGDAALLKFLEASDDLMTEQLASALLEKVLQWPGRSPG